MDITGAESLPAHIGILMDGNRRWAKARGLPSNMGHREGAKVFKRRVEDLTELGIKHATFFAFSTENLRREADEVNSLMRLFEAYLDDIKKTPIKNVKLEFIGDLSLFTEKLQKKAREAEQQSAGNTGLYCRLALNYGGRAEIVHAARSIAEKAACGELQPEAVGENDFNGYLYTKDAPAADLIIRTGGEKRLSNFLLWQAAYAELYFTDTLWCDFTRDELMKALEDYAGRVRRFGS